MAQNRRSEAILAIASNASPDGSRGGGLGAAEAAGKALGKNASILSADRQFQRVEGTGRPMLRPNGGFRRRQGPYASAVHADSILRQKL